MSRRGGSVAARGTCAAVCDAGNRVAQRYHPRHAGSKLAQVSRQPIQCMKHAPHCWAVVEGRAPTPTYNARVICGSMSPASAHNEESDTPRRRTPLRIGNCAASNSSLIDAKVERSEIGAM